MSSIFQITQLRAFKLSDNVKAKSQIVSVSFPQPALPHVDYKAGANKGERMIIVHLFESTNLARIHCTTASSSFSCVKRSETDTVGMNIIVRSQEDTGYKNHAHYFQSGSSRGSRQS